MTLLSIVASNKKVTIRGLIRIRSKEIDDYFGIKYVVSNTIHPYGIAEIANTRNQV